MVARLIIAALAIGCTIALAACGSAHSHATASSSSNSALVAARCMRAHGVPNFPDPGPSGGFSVVMTPEGRTTVNGVSVGGPAYQSAARTCRFAGGPRNPPVPEHEKLALLAFARCMRHHGFPRWTDPTFPPGGGVMGGGGYPFDTPGLKPAATMCNRAAELTGS